MTYDVLKSRPSSSSLSSFYHSSIPHVQLPVLGVRGEKDYTALHTLICSWVCSLHSNLTLMCICNKADGNVSTCGCLEQKHLSAGLRACVCVAGCGSTDCLPAEVIIDCQEAAPSARDLLRFINSTDCTGKHYKFIQKWLIIYIFFSVLKEG